MTLSNPEAPLLARLLLLHLLATQQQQGGTQNR
jgi:hypothetical protein